MKKIVFIIFGMSLMGCNLYDVGNDISYRLRISEGFLYEDDIKEDLENIEDIEDIMDKIKYVSDTYDEWKSSVDTYKELEGDCEDFAILFINLYYIVYGEKCSLVLVDVTRSILEGGFVNHARVILPNGDHYDPQLGRTVSKSYSGYVYYFDDLFTL